MGLNAGFVLKLLVLCVSWCLCNIFMFAQSRPGQTVRLELLPVVEIQPRRESLGADRSVFVDCRGNLCMHVITELLECMLSKCEYMLSVLLFCFVA